MKQVPSDMRKNFSRRDAITKCHNQLNDFEKELKNKYEEASGVKLVVRTLEERRKKYGKLSR